MNNVKHQQRVSRKRRTAGKLQNPSKRPRLVVFKSLNNNYAQIVDDQSNKTIVGTSDLKIKTGTKMEKAKQVGLELAKMAKEKKIDTCVFDRNGFRFHGRIKAIAEGAREGGLKF